MCSVVSADPASHRLHHTLMSMRKARKRRGRLSHRQAIMQARGCSPRSSTLVESRLGEGETRKVRDELRAI